MRLLDTTLPRSVRVLLIVIAAGAVLPGARAMADEQVEACGSYQNHVFQAWSGTAAYALGSDCTGSNSGTLSITTAQGTFTQGQAAHWEADAPAGLTIVGAQVASPDLFSSGVNSGQQFGGGFYYQGGGPEVFPNESSIGFGPISSPYVGFQLVCGVRTCNASPGAAMYVIGITLYVRETSGPSLVAPIGLWQASGWVRGTWRFFAWGNSPSGLCSISASLNGQLINTMTSAQDVSQWHQCAAAPINQPVDTSRYGQGALPLTLSTWDAAGVPATTTKTVYIDNSTPTISLSGPVDAPSTAGTQYVIASAGRSPSGIADIVCSVDGGPGQTYSGASAQVPVSGIGPHTVSCYANDNAVDSSGVNGRSTTASWSLKIGQPSVVGIGFNRLVGLRCHRAGVRVRVPGHWITVRRHGRRVNAKTRAHTKVERVERCHPRTVRRRTVVFVPVRRHGHIVKVKRIKIERVVVSPHTNVKDSRRVAFGRGTTVNGYLGTTAGTALSSHSVRVLTAPDNGTGQFTQAAVVTTAANGTWTAQLPPGPSRIVEAVYDGDPTTEAASSGQVRVIVPGKVKLLHVSPRRVAWGGTVRITGQLLGGYLPAGGALVRLRIGSGSSHTTYGVQEHVTGNGRFTTTYTFGAGQASSYQRFWFQIASLPMGAYPYAPSDSGRRSVLVGGHPAIPHRRDHRARHRKRRR